MLSNVRALYQVMRDAKLPRSELDRVIRQRLKAVLISAYLHVPYYRELMQTVGYDPVRDYCGPEDLSWLPVTTKAILKERGIESFLREATEPSGYFTDSTSGSTGIPITVYRSHHERAVQVAKWLRVLFLNGYSVRQRVMSLTSPDRLAAGRSIIQRFGFLRRLTVNYLLPPDEVVDILLDYEPHVLYGNRAHLDTTSLELMRRGTIPDRLKLLIGTGEVIHESSRQLYREAFGVELIESYGSVEMGVMAYQMPESDGLHLCEDLTFFEFLDECGKPVPPGKPGRVVVTDLIGKTMPFIRYDQGDLVVFDNSEDKNGNLSRRLTQVIGRDNDYVVLPDGTRRLVHDYLIPLMSKFSDIKQFRIVQRTINLFQILVIADTAYLLSIRNDLLHQLQERFPPTVRFEIVSVDRIEPDHSGKIRMIISEVD